MKDAVIHHETIWERAMPWLLDYMKPLLEKSGVYGAFYNGSMVGFGSIEFPEGSRFWEAHGGLVFQHIEK
ncbi:MAG: hypothetical protein CMI18_12200 [Opitutaceae bacterium]|nr:hypothetical protein [Opitutaceae bacterium]